MGIALGTSVEVPGVTAEAFAELGQTVHNIHKHITRGRAKPVIKIVSGGLTVPAAPTLPQLLVCNTYPAIGRMWNILKIGVYGADLHTAIASVNVDVYSGTMPDPVTPPALTQGITTLGIPGTFEPSKDVEWCEQGEQLFALLYGAGVVAGINVTLMARVAEYNVFDVEAGRIP